MPFREGNRHLTLTIISIVASLMVVAIGVQAWLANEDNQDRDRADRAYADCLTDFASDLVTTIEARAEATARLEKARARRDAVGAKKDNLLDRLFELQAEADATGAETNEELEEIKPGLIEEYRAVIQKRVKVQAVFDEVDRRVRDMERRVEETRSQNPYLAPEVVCQR